MAITEAQKRGLLPQKRPANQEVESLDPSENKGYQVNLDNLDVHRLTMELIAKYNQNNDAGVIQNFFRRNRIAGQEKYLRTLMSYVQSVRENSHDLIEFKAQLMSQQQVLGNLITGKIEESQFLVDRQREEHVTFLTGQEAERQRIWVELERARNENATIRYTAQKARWEAEEARQKARITKLRGNLIEKIIDELKFADINMKQVFVLIEMIKDATSSSDIFEADARWEQLKAEAKRTMAQAEQETTKAEWEKFKFKQESKEPDF